MREGFIDERQPGKSVVIESCTMLEPENIIKRIKSNSAGINDLILELLKLQHAIYYRVFYFG